MMLRLVVYFLLWATCTSALAQNPGWSSAWYTSGQPELSSRSTAMVRTTTGQLVVFYGNDDNWGYQVTSMTPAGVVNWQINLADYFDSGQVAAGPDGSVFVSTQGATARIDGSGNVLWHRNALHASGFALANGAFYSENCNALARLDVNTGATIWLVETADSIGCSTGADADAAGNVYLITWIGDATPYSTSQIKLAKFDPNGTSLWQLSITVSGTFARIVGVSDGRLYAQQGPDVAAYDAASGTPLWVHPQMDALLLAGIPASPLANDSDGMHRLNPSDGHIEWTGGAVQIPPVAGQGQDAYLCSNGYVSKFNATSGMGDWSFDLHSTPWSCLALAFGGGNVSVANIDLTGVLRIDTIAAASGAAVNTALAAPTQQGIVVYDSFIDNGRIVQAGKLSGTTDYHLRSIDAGTGSVDWDVVFTPPLNGWGPLLGRSADSIIVTDYTATGSCSSCGSDFWIGSFARSDGALRWSKTELGYAPLYGISTAWSSAPVTDSHGDVYVSYSQTGACPYYPYNYCYTSSLMKLAAADGSVLWHFDSMADYDASFDGMYGFAPPFTLIDDDVLVAGNFTDALAGKNIVRLSGIDGTLMWSATPLAGRATSYVALNPDHTITLTDGSSRALLEHSGTVLWTDDPVLPCLTGCLFYGAAQLPDGTQLYSGVDAGLTYPRIGFVMSLPLAQNAMARRAPVNGDAPATVRTIPLQLIADDTTVWLRGSMKQPPYTYFYFLGKLDPVTLAVSDQQVLSTMQADAFAPSSSFAMLAAPTHDLLPVVTSLWGAGASFASGAALLETTIAVRGDLALSVSATDNIDDSTFRATVTYAGDAPAATVRLMLWHQGYFDADSLACSTVNASNCVATSHSGYVEATFDIQPGGSIKVSGSYPRSKMLSTLYGSVHGAASLAEPSLGNNFSSAPVGDLLFRDGFE